MSMVNLSESVLFIMSLLHPRNKHTGRYDFDALYSVCPELKCYTRLNPAGRYTIDFADPTAVKLLNSAILKHDYGVSFWDIPSGYLCPPIPGRADYIHGLADLLALDQPEHQPPTGANTKLLDIGVGANLIYPLLGQAEYGWSFVGADIDNTALQAAQCIIDANGLAKKIQLRHQTTPEHLFQSIIRPNEFFAATLCNPPFFHSAEQAQRQNQRKWKNLGKAQKQRNFGGQSNELWCEGGEAAFILRMIDESQHYGDQVGWFTTLVSRENNLGVIDKQLQRVRATQVRTIDMAQGQKKSRFVAWRFV